MPVYVLFYSFISHICNIILLVHLILFDVIMCCLLTSCVRLQRSETIPFPKKNVLFTYWNSYAFRSLIYNVEDKQISSWKTKSWMTETTRELFREPENEKLGWSGNGPLELQNRPEWGRCIYWAWHVFIVLVKSKILLYSLKTSEIFPSDPKIDWLTDRPVGTLLIGRFQAEFAVFV
jgi:hypothetical protein